ENVYCFTDNFLVGNPDPRVKAWVDSYASRFKVPPDSYSVAAYDGVVLLNHAIEVAGTGRKAIRDALAATKNFEGIGNIYSFDAKGDGVHEVVVLKAKHATKDFELVEKVSGND